MAWDSSWDGASQSQSRQTIGGTSGAARAAWDTSQQGGTTGGNDPIPGSGNYLAQEALAQRAYEEAVSELNSQRNSLYHQYGLSSTGKIDPHSQFGDYQSMLGNEGLALDQARDDSASRGLGAGGLANQSQQALKTADNSEHLQFQQRVDQTQQNYEHGLVQAKDQEEASILAAEQGGYANALSQGLFNIAPPAGQTTTQTAPTTPGGGTGNSGYDYSKTILKQYLTGQLYSRKSRSNLTGLTGQGSRGIITIH